MSNREEALARLRRGNEVVQRRAEKKRLLKSGELGLVDVAGDSDFGSMMAGEVVILLPRLRDSEASRRRVTRILRAVHLEDGYVTPWREVSERQASEILRALGRES